MYSAHTGASNMQLFMQVRQICGVYADVSDIQVCETIDCGKGQSKPVYNYIWLNRGLFHPRCPLLCELKDIITQLK